MLKLSKYPRGGFTLIELLVVVLIIGILAAIALPQYQMAVGKTKFSTLKNITKSLQQSAQRYYMVYNTYEELNGSNGRKNLDIEIPNDISCNIQKNNDQVYCCKEIFQTNMCFYVYRENGLPLYCYTSSTDKNDKTHIFCQKETGKKRREGDGPSWYHY